MMENCYVYFGDIKNVKHRITVSKLLQKAALDASILWHDGSNKTQHVDLAIGYDFYDGRLYWIGYVRNWYKKQGIYANKLSITQWLNKMEEIKEDKGKC